MATGNQVLPGAPVARERRQDQSRRDLPRRGTGGRWAVWTLRIVAWMILLLIGYRGVAAIVTGSTITGNGAAPASRPYSAFPFTLAQAYALAFGQAYLNFSPATATERAGDLAAFLPPGVDSQLGWNGTGTQVLSFEQVAGVTVRDAQHAIVTLLAKVNDHLIELGVPIFAASGGLVVSGPPALLPPPRTAVLPAPPQVAADQATQAVLAHQLPGFFRAFAGADRLTLDRFLVRGAAVTGLGGAVTFGGIQQITVPAVGGSVRHIEVTVVWKVTSQTSAHGTPVASNPAQIPMTYAMTVVRIGGSWYVRSIGAADSPGS